MNRDSFPAYAYWHSYEIGIQNRQNTIKSYKTDEHNSKKDQMEVLDKQDIEFEEEVCSKCIDKRASIILECLHCCLCQNCII